MKQLLAIAAACTCALALGAAPASAARTSYELSCTMHFDGTDWVVHATATTWPTGTDYIQYNGIRGKNQLGGAGYQLILEPLSGNQATLTIQDKPSKMLFTFLQGGWEGTPIGSGSVHCANTR